MELRNINKINDYLNDVCSQISFKEIHKEVESEIQSHITELIDTYLGEGLSEDDSVDMAIIQMGDASSIGSQLNKVHKSKPEWSIAALTFVLAVFGFIINYFIAAQGVSNHDTYSILIRSLFFSILGISITLAIYFFDYKRIKAYSKYIYIITSIIMLAAVYSGNTLNSHTSWFSLNLILLSIQACPIFYIIALSGIMDSLNWNKPRDVIYSLFLFLIPVILMISLPSLTGALIYSIAFLVIALMSGAKLRYVFGVVSSGLAAFMLYIFTKEYLIRRLLSFLNPDKDPSGTGYMNIHLKTFLHSAGLFGQGFTSKIGAIPSVSTDYVFVYIVYTFGWAAGILILALLVSLIIRITGLISIVKSSYGKLLIGGFAALFSIQCFWNILKIMGLAFIGGTPLPFISYGGTQFTVNMIMIGLILSIYRRRDIKGIAKEL